MTNEELLSVAEIVDRLVTRFHKQAADHEAKMVEYRAAFGVRTDADAKIITGLREERAKLLTQVQDMRAEMEQLRSANRIMQQDAEDGYTEAIKVIGDPIALSKERDALRAEVAELKTQLERLTSWATKNQAARETLQSEIERLKSQTPEATHDTEAGKSAAESAAKTEPVANEIKVGDLVEVYQATCPRWTTNNVVGLIGIVTRLMTRADNMMVVTIKSNYTETVALADVRKVTT